MFPIIEHVCERLTKYIQTEIDKKSEGIEAREVTTLHHLV